jgi:uncharacterized membrane protein YtjA (UPF0391 family)
LSQGGSPNSAKIRCFPVANRIKSAIGTVAAKRGSSSTFQAEELAMLYWAAVFFVIALLAAVFGFGGLAASAAGVAKILFFVFLVFALVSFLFGRRSPAA